MSAGPQRPRLTFAVGITGHRPNKLSASALTRAESQLAAVFAAIDAACAVRLARDASCYAKMPHRVKLVSSFAEGIDQLAVKMRPAHWDVAAILPFPRVRYEEDFVSRDERGAIVSDRRAEFASALREASEVVELPEEDGAPAAYARAGAFTLRQIDLLVAVWDGAEAAGKGGTAHVVAEALAGGIPVVWIASARDQQPWLIEHKTDVQRETPLTDATLGPIAKAVEAAIGVAPATSRRLADFLAERHHGGENGSHSFDPSRWLARMWSLGRSPPTRDFTSIRRDWAIFLERLPEGENFKARIEDMLLPRFIAAETLAEDYSHAGRGANLLFYLLSFAAVAMALFGASSLGAFGPKTEGAIAIGAFWALCELLVIGAILAMVRTDEKRRWRERAFDYRALAEGLRHLRFLAPIGECANQPLRRGPSAAMGDWVVWYLRATVRELGSPRALLDAKYQMALLSAVEKTEVDQGIAWHRDNAKRLDSLQLTLLHVAEACFLGAAALLGISLALFVGWLGLRLATPLAQGDASAGFISWDERLRHFFLASRPFLIFAAALLPCLGAVVAAIRLVGRFERAADRSVQALAALQGLKTDYAVARERLEHDKTAVTLLDTARIEAETVDACRALYGRRRLTLPV
jgi:hypothetical protein